MLDLRVLRVFVVRLVRQRVEMRVVFCTDS